MSTSTNKHRYKNKLLGFRRHGGKHCVKSAILSSELSYISPASSV